MKKIYNVFFKQLKNKKIVAMVVAFTFLIPNLTILFHAESPNLADISVNTKLTASASVNNGDAPGAFQYNGTWQNTNEAPIGGGSRQWLALNFGETVTFNSVKFQQYGRRLKQFSIQTSEDGESWTTVFRGLDTSVPAEVETWNEYTSVRLDNPVTSQYFRLLMEEVFANEPKVIIGQIFIYNDAAFAATPEVENITNRPTELAHGLDIGAYSASSDNGGDQTADKAFDEYDWSPWQAAGGAQINAPQWLMVDFGSSKTVSRVDLSQYNNRAKLFKLQVSDDKATWKDAFYGKVEGAADNGGTVNYTVVFPEATGRYFRILFEETAGDAGGAQTQPAVFDMSIYDKPGSAVTSSEIECIAEKPTELAHGLDISAYSASSDNGGDQTADKAFDEYDWSPWQAAGGAQINAPQWLMVDFGSSKTVSRVDLSQYNNRAKLFKLQVSDDKATWKDAFYGKVEGAADNGGTVNYTVVFPEATGRYFRILFEETAGDASGAQTQPAVFDMSIYDKPDSAVTSPEIECIAEKPTELAHGLNIGAYSASSYNGGDQTADKAFDEYDWSPWQAAGGAQINAPQWLMVDFGSSKTVSRVDLSQYNNRAKLFKLQVSDDKATWKDAFYGKVEGAADNGGTVNYTVVFPEATGRYFRILFEETAGDASGAQTQPAVFDMSIYDKPGSAVTSPEITSVTVKPDAVRELTQGLPTEAFRGSTEQKNQEAKYAFDADIYSVWQAESTAQVGASQWLMVDFGKEEVISRIDFIQYRNRARQFKLQVSNDTETWTDAYKGNVPSATDSPDAANAAYTIVFPSVNGRYFRILFLDMAGKAEDNTVPSMPAVFDMKIYDKHDGAQTSAEVHEGLLDSEDSFKPAAPVNPIVKPENLALNKGDSAYSSSSNLDGQPPQAAFDGNGSSNWQNSGNNFPAWIQVDLGEKTDVNGLWISQWSNRIKYFKIHVSDDGRNWATAFYGRVTDAAELPTATELSIAFPTVKTRFVRFTITDGVYDEPNKQLFNIPIYEIEVYSSDDWQSSENVIDVETEKPTRETLNALREILQRIESLDEATYTEKSFEALKRVYLKAKEYENGDVGNNTAVLEIIEELKQAEKDLIPISTYNELRDQLKEILQMDPSKYHTDDWNSLMLLTEYANVLLQQGNADTADVSFYVKSIDILLSSMRMADEENLEYIYEVNPAKSDEYLKEEIVIDGYDKDPVATGETNFVVYAILSAVLSMAAIIVIRKKSTR